MPLKEYLRLIKKLQAESSRGKALDQDVQEIIRRFDLKPLEIEGGYFRETYRSKYAIKNEGKKKKHVEDYPRSACTQIYYLITPSNFSHLHMLSGDEVFHFYMGDAVEMLLLYPGGFWELKTLGPDFKKEQEPQIIVPGGTWQGAMLKEGGEFALLGTTVCPGFEYSDYRPAKDFYAEITSKFSSCKEIIEKYI